MQSLSTHEKVTKATFSDKSCQGTKFETNPAMRQLQETLPFL